MKTINIIILAILVLAILPRARNNDCRSHETFMFHCHHNDSNTDIYLRRVIAKIERILDQVDKTPEELKEFNEIKEAAIEAQIILSSTFDQLALLNSDDLHIGAWANFQPDFLRSEDDRAFDFAADAAVRLLAEIRNHTQEESALLRATLLKRTMKREVIKKCGLWDVRRYMNPLIDETIAKAMIKMNDGKIPSNLTWLVHEFKKTVKDSLIESIIKDVSDGTIGTPHQLEQRIKYDFC